VKVDRDGRRTFSREDLSSAVPVPAVRQAIRGKELLERRLARRLARQISSLPYRSERIVAALYARWSALATKDLVTNRRLSESFTASVDKRVRVPALASTIWQTSALASS
jgi:hypothetical protein